MAMKNNFLALMSLLLLLSLCLLMGCGGDTDTETASGTTETDTIAPSTDVPTEAPAETGESVAETEPVTELVTEPVTEPATEPATEDYFASSRIDLVVPDPTQVPDMTVIGDGYDIYQLTEGREWGYRYGCTYLYNDDGSVDAYFACVGTISGEWDWIAYRHSPDGGETWGNEKIVLTPTQGSMDHFSNCDPGVVYFDGYYYLGYTSTLNSTGLCNNLFVARSENPDGPFEKWNGSGWGGPDCQPIVYFDEDWSKWGIGEPSFVELNGTLYLYYTCTTASGDYTMVATADATDENWPATLQFHGAACKKNSDSLDVKYVEEWGKFVAVGTADRMSANSWLAVYESNDGLSFTLADCVKEDTYQYLHNAGLSSRRNGHIRIAEDYDKLRVIYAYGDGWGVWNARVQPITLVLSDGNDINAERAKRNLPDPGNRAPKLSRSDRTIAMIRTERDVYEYPLSQGSFDLTLFTYDTYFERASGKKYLSKVTYSGYDPSVITIEDGHVTIVGTGETTVTLTYEGLKSLFWVRITETDETGDGNTATDFVAVKDTYTICYAERSDYRPQIRGRIKWDDGSFTELYVDKQESYALTFTGYDESIISVSAKGVITARKVGKTDVTVSWNGMSFTVHVVVSKNAADGFFSKQAEEIVLDYTNIDFTRAESTATLGQTNHAEYETTEGGLKLTVTGGDTFVWLNYFKADDPIQTADYSAIEITYMVPTECSAGAKTTFMQCFILCVDSSALAEPNSLRPSIVADGEYHTIRLELAGQSFWHDDFYAMRFDFFNSADAGDVMYLQSVKLVK